MTVTLRIHHARLPQLSPALLLALAEYSDAQPAPDDSGDVVFEMGAAVYEARVAGLLREWVPVG